MISEYLTKDNINLGFKAENWEAAIKKSGSILEANDLIEPEYIDAMIEMVKDKGAYIVITPGLALPHARPEKGAKKNGLSLLTLKEPVEFGHSKNDPVKVVISFCAADDSTHTQMLSELAEFLKDKKNVNYIKEVGSKKELLSYFENYDRGGESNEDLDSMRSRTGQQSYS
ncbi:PTS system IIA component (L-Asc family) [Halanaerobium saccharolyticum]|uniref:Ascorbate-specific PTS system EIIA component n=1 Tax=Halanaerobium saccharolyticum TaxID=43595 RepID=A0A4R7Z9D0_9FIRM|nr:PTS sugar transporter subunit IIA [Halanaerobium saccharolyticum]RAK12496.1 PTS system IIA component (L-Asc family) [Halanaerobium saccharolyticum]TDW06422.1 PTS system IIA component (L-Asc family) [Halanaerobium saccharolyticum]TDX61670.1 PTS system IIA component (L-Asc family) [Halanaerobium saccharolyticum]